ncbi:hypothetical protein GCM10018790_14480 [Kitasatospora xanthocidica]|nr:hypothetical protein GCM10018790_14480 [Kitasatospora xanthocidica]
MGTFLALTGSPPAASRWNTMHTSQLRPHHTPLTRENPFREFAARHGEPAKLPQPLPPGGIRPADPFTCGRAEVREDPGTVRIIQVTLRHHGAPGAGDGRT